MKLIKAVAPYNHPEFLNFKAAPYEAWVRCGGQVAKAHYPARPFHKLAYEHELPTLWKNNKEARLRFVEPISITFDTFPDYARYEIIPFVWDCWPRYFERICYWLQRYKVRTAIFTSSQTVERMRMRLPEMNVLYCPEAVDTSIYAEGKLLRERRVDFLEFGRSHHKVLKLKLPEYVNYVCTVDGDKFLYTDEQLREIMGDSKVTIAFPRNLTNPWEAGDIETLTQRYWENMLSRIVIVGHAPKELSDMIGYNPVIELNTEQPNEHILYILNHIDDYQELVNRNRNVALTHSDWKLRMELIMPYLRQHGYVI